MKTFIFEKDGESLVINADNLQDALKQIKEQKGTSRGWILQGDQG